MAITITLTWKQAKLVTRALVALWRKAAAKYDPDYKPEPGKFDANLGLMLQTQELIKRIDEALANEEETSDEIGN